MRGLFVLVAALVIAAPGAFLALRGQEPAGRQVKRFAAPPDQDVAIRAGRLFNSRTEMLQLTSGTVSPVTR